MIAEYRLFAGNRSSCFISCDGPIEEMVSIPEMAELIEKRKEEMKDVFYNTDCEVSNETEI